MTTDSTTPPPAAPTLPTDAHVSYDVAVGPALAQEQGEHLPDDVAPVAPAIAEPVVSPSTEA